MTAWSCSIPGREASTPTSLQKPSVFRQCENNAASGTISHQQFEPVTATQSFGSQKAALMLKITRRDFVAAATATLGSLSLPERSSGQQPTGTEEATSPLRLWYESPASRWV